MASPDRAPRLQFGLRWLFALIALVAACAAVWRVSGVVETIGTGMSLVALAASITLPRFRFSLAARVALSVAGVAVLWFVAVDRSWFIYNCEHCHLQRSQVETRVFRHPIHAWHRDLHSPIDLIAEDLGIPCNHSFEGWQKHRWWGLVCCWCPCINGTWGISGADWYDEPKRKYVRRWAQEDPRRIDEFRAEVLVKHNMAYLKRFYAEIDRLDEGP